MPRSMRKNNTKTIIDDKLRAEFQAAADPELQARARKRITLYGEIQRQVVKFDRYVLDDDGSDIFIDVVTQ